jgi:hypothetical protein
MDLTGKDKGRDKKYHHLHTVLTWGKHEGQSIEDIITDHPKYIEWCLENLDWFDLSKSAMEYYNEMNPGLTQDEEDDPYPEDLD